jgi:hypothetical protein
MSVRTSADEHLDSAKEYLNLAILNLNKIVVERVWGAEEFSKEYTEIMTETMFELLKIQNKLGRPE